MRVARRYHVGQDSISDSDPDRDLVDDYVAVDLAELPARTEALPVEGSELRIVRDTVYVLLFALGYKPSQIEDVAKSLACTRRHIRRRITAAYNEVGGDEAELLERVILSLRRYQRQQHAG